MKINKLGMVAFGVGFGATIVSAVLFNQLKKHGGHITVGIGSREIGWYFDAKRKEVGEP